MSYADIWNRKRLVVLESYYIAEPFRTIRIFWKHIDIRYFPPFLGQYKMAVFFFQLPALLALCSIFFIEFLQLVQAASMFKMWFFSLISNSAPFKLIFLMTFWGNGFVIQFAEKYEIYVQKLKLWTYFELKTSFHN